MDKLSERIDSFVSHVNKTDQRIIYLEKQLHGVKLLLNTQQSNKIPMQQATPPPPYPILNPNFRSKPPAMHYGTAHRTTWCDKMTPGTHGNVRQSVPAKVLGNHVNSSKQQQTVENVNTKEHSDGNQIDDQTPKCSEASPTEVFTH